MKNIEISKELVEKAQENHYDYGAESYIIKSSHNTLYKIFKEKDPNVLENKLQKVIRIPKKKVDFFTNPISTLSCEGNFVGIEMNYVEDESAWWKYNLNPIEKIKLLLDLKEKLLILEDKNIIYGDIKDDNILINKNRKEIKFCDVDNISIDEYKMDLHPAVLKITKLEDASSIHSFMHNFFTLDQLECPGLSYDRVLYNLNDYELFNFNLNAYNILREMSMLKERQKVKIYTGGYLIDNLRKIR